MATLITLLKRINTNYHLAVTISLICGLIVVPLFGLGIVYQICALPLSAPLWIATFWVINNVVSGSSYIGTLLDYLLGNRTFLSCCLGRDEQWRASDFENILTILGVAIVAPMLIYVLFAAGQLDVTESLGLAIGLFSMRLIGIGGGCGTRMGRVAHGYYHSSFEDNHFRIRGRRRRVLPYYGLFVFFTALSASTIILLCAPPGTLAGLGLAFIYVSNMVSGASYIGRVTDYFRVGFGNSHWQNTLSKKWESVLTLLGIIFSIIVGYLYVPLGMITVIQSFPEVLIVTANVFTAMGVFGGLCNRIGKVIDKCTSPLSGEGYIPPAFLALDPDDDGDDDKLPPITAAYANQAANQIAQVQDPALQRILAENAAWNLAPLMNVESSINASDSSQPKDHRQEINHCRTQ